MSRLPFELVLALRYLRPKRTFVSIITLISVLGVTLGVAVLIIVISVMSGFDHDLREKVLGFTSHLKVFAVNPKTGDHGLLQNYERIASIVSSNANVAGVAPFGFGRVLIETEREGDLQEIDAPWLRGMDPQVEITSMLISSNIVQGTNDLVGDGLLVGSEIAQRMKLRVGERVAVYSAADLNELWKRRKDTNKPDEISPPKDFQVRGVFDTGYWEYNASVIVTSIQNFQDLYRLDDDVHGLMVMLKDPYQADAVRNQLAQTLGAKYDVTTWSDENNVMLAVLVEKNVMLYILFFIVIVAAFGITCTLITFVVMKTREIGVLKALGASQRHILWVFLSQSMVVSVLGVLTGLGAGLLAVAYRNEFLLLMRRVTGLELFPASIYGFSKLPALIVPGDIAIICGGSFLICLLAAAFPAWHASRLKPVEALRHE